MTIHHILIGRAANINSNIVRFFADQWEALGTREDEHVFHLLQRRSDLSAAEAEYFDRVTVRPGALAFVDPTRRNILRLLLTIGPQDLLILHSGRSNDVILALCATPWLWHRSAMICFGGEVRIWTRIAAARDIASRLYRLSQRTVLKRLRAICTLTPAEYVPIRALFPGADNYRRAFMSTSPSAVPALAPRVASAAGTLRVLLNQSADAGGRHREALEWLSAFRDQNVHVTCPVSFGSRQEAESVIEAGRAILGPKFSWIETKMPYERYRELLRENVDVLVLNHVCQAALGHLYMFLCDGKVAYIRRETPVRGLLGDLGIAVRCTNEIPTLTYQEFASPWPHAVAMANLERFNEHLSTEASVRACAALIQTMRSGND